MDDPQLYVRANDLQRQIARETLECCVHLMKWKSEPAVMDIGCGTGDVTTEVLCPRIPVRCGRLVATDISARMIEHAGRAGAAKIEFETLDISAPALSDRLKGSFDHVFSFNCLHWVKNQTRAFSNIHDLLKLDGDFLVNIVTDFFLFDIYLRMSTMAKWTTYMQDVEDILPPHYYCQEVEKTVNELLYRLGFVIYHCELRTKHHRFGSWRCCRDMFVGVNPFLPRIPDDLKDDYVADLMGLAKETYGPHVEGDGSFTVPCKYVVACASKTTRNETSR